MSGDIGIGRIIPKKQDAKRDAIHVAVVPMVAGELLCPGQRIKFGDRAKKTAVNAADSDEAVGVVDPFLKTNVPKGQTFWIFLPPGSITSLRHDWTHPAFENDEDEKKKWAYIDELANSVGISRGRLMDAAGYYMETGNHIVGGSKMEGVSVPDEFWDHYMNVTNKEVTDDQRGNFFRCAC